MRDWFISPPINKVTPGMGGILMMEADRIESDDHVIDDEFAEVRCSEAKGSGEAVREAIPDEGMEDDDVSKALVKTLRDPGVPTQAEIDEHDPTHLPFRSWCEHCKGKSPISPTRHKREERISTAFYILGLFVT